VLDLAGNQMDQDGDGVPGESGDDVFYAAEEMVGASDIELLRKALSDNRIVLTFDRDFGELVFRNRQPAAPGIAALNTARRFPQTRAGA
jgi:predicted nuclease of predicted toxin-antitoxin system